MTPKQKAIARAKELGVEIKIEGAASMEVNLYAPVGKKFQGSGLHMTVNASDGRASSTQLWKGALEDMEMGLMDCDEGPECDYCNEVKQ